MIELVELALLILALFLALIAFVVFRNLCENCSDRLFDIWGALWRIEAALDLMLKKLKEDDD